MPHPTSYQVKIPFGKYSALGLSFGEIYDKNKSYLEWLCGAEKIEEIWRVIAAKTLFGEAIDLNTIPKPIEADPVNDTRLAGNVTITTIRNSVRRFLVTFPPDMALAKKLDYEIDGVKEEKQAGGYSFPAPQIVRVVNFFGGPSKLSVHEKVRERYLFEKERARRLKEIAQKMDSTYDAPLLLPLRPYQRVVLEFADIAGGNILEADPVGMGKTPISLGLAENNGGITLVICLKNLKIQWETQIKRFTGKDSCIWDAEGAHGNKKAKYHIVHFNVVDRFVSEFNKLKLTNLIIDEGTLLTNHKSIRTKAVFGDYEAPRQYPGIKAKNNYILTGTPLRNRPREMYTLLHFLDPDRFSNPKHFIKRYERGGFAKKLEEFDNLDELFERASELMIRRPKSIRPGEKKPEREELLVEMTPEERIEYDSFMNALFNKWETTSPSAAHMAPIRNFLFKIKWERLTEFIDKLLESDRPVLVFGIQQNHVEKIAAQYGEISAYVHGGINDESERERIKQALIAGSLKVGAYTLATGGMGMDGLQKTISDTIFIDRSYVPADHEQAEGRTARDGQMSVPQMWYMTVVGTVEEIQREMLSSKQGIFDQAVDGKTTDQIKASQAMKQSMFKEFVARLAKTTGRTFKSPLDD